MAFWVSGNIVEQDRGVSYLPLIDIENGANFAFSIRSSDVLEFPRCLHLAEPAAQILLRRVSAGAWRIHSLIHGLVSPVCASVKAAQYGCSPSRVMRRSILRSCALKSVLACRHERLSHKIRSPTCHLCS